MRLVVLHVQRELAATFCFYVLRIPSSLEQMCANPAPYQIVRMEGCAST